MTEHHCNTALIFFLSLALLLGFYIQFFMNYAEPCPLCLLIRSAMIGVCAGLLMNIKFGIHIIYYLLAALFVITGFITALVQASLDGCIGYVCPDQPQIPFIFFGMDLALWAMVIFATCLVAIGLFLILFRKKNWGIKLSPVPLWHRIVFTLLFLICLVNIGTIFRQCGWGLC